METFPWNIWECSCYIINLENVDWDFLTAKLVKKFDAWAASSASSGARIILINASLYGIHLLYVHIYAHQSFHSREKRKNTEGIFPKKVKEESLPYA